MNERGTSGVGSATLACAGMQKSCSVIDSEGLLGHEILWVSHNFDCIPAVLPLKFLLLPSWLFFPPTDGPGMGCKGVWSFRREGLKLGFSFL